MLKKAILLASMVLALAALAAPAAQAGTEWTNEGAFEARGELTNEKGVFVTGPMPFNLQVSLANGEVSGEGEVTNGEIEGMVSTNVPDCHAAATVNKASLPWSIALTTPDTIEIGGHPGGVSRTATFTFHYTTTPSETGGCLGVGATGSITGTFTGTVENSANEVCINLNTGVDDLYVEGTNYTGGQFDMTGVLCIEGTEA